MSERLSRIISNAFTVRVSVDKFFEAREHAERALLINCHAYYD